MMYTFICMFKHSFISHQPVLNSNSKNSRTSSPWTPCTWRCAPCTTPGRAWSLPTTGRGRWRRPLTRTATVKQQQQQQQERRPLHREFLLPAQAGNGAEAAHTKYQEVQAECRVLWCLVDVFFKSFILHRIFSCSAASQISATKWQMTMMK